MKKNLLLILILLFTIQLEAQESKRFAIGGGVGYDGYDSFRGELYARINFKNIFNRRAAARIGLSNRSYEFDFCKIDGYKANSINLFADVYIYPVKSLDWFAGVRLETVNLNWIGSATRRDIERETGYQITPVYISSGYFAVTGYDFKLSEKLNLKLYGMIGLHRYSITDGIYSYWNFVVGGDKVEGKNDFNYNLNMSLEYTF